MVKSGQRPIDWQTVQAGSGKRPAILLLCPVMPGRGGTGIAMRGGAFLDAAHQIGDVDLLVVPIVSSRAQDVAFARRRCRRLMMVENKDRRDTLFALIQGTTDEAQRLAMFQAYGKPSICSIFSAPVVRDACDFVESDKYDITIVQRSYMLPLISAIRRKTDTGPVFVDLDDDDASASLEIAHRQRSEGMEAAALWLEVDAAGYDKLVTDIDRVASLTAMANQDAIQAVSRRLQIVPPVFVPNCIEIHEQGEPVRKPVMLFVGTMGYKPNEDGALWLLREVLPLVRAAVADVRLIIAGHSAGKVLERALPVNGVSVVSDPDDMADLYRSSALVVVPLFSGSGTRIKILEAGAYGLAVVSTHKGAEGLGIEDGTHGWIVEAEAADFAAACIAALESGAERDKRAKRLREHVSLLYERGMIVDRIAGLLQSQIETVD